MSRSQTRRPRCRASCCGSHRSLQSSRRVELEACAVAQRGGHTELRKLRCKEGNHQLIAQSSSAYTRPYEDGSLWALHPSKQIEVTPQPSSGSVRWASGSWLEAVVSLTLEHTKSTGKSKYLFANLITYKCDWSCTLVKAKVDTGLFLLRCLALTLKLACCLASLLRLLDGRVDWNWIYRIYNRLSIVFASLTVGRCLATLRSFFSIFTVIRSLVASTDWLSSVFVGVCNIRLQLVDVGSLICIIRICLSTFGLSWVCVRKLCLICISSHIFCSFCISRIWDLLSLCNQRMRVHRRAKSALKKTCLLRGHLTGKFMALTSLDACIRGVIVHAETQTLFVTSIWTSQNKLS